METYRLTPWSSGQVGYFEGGTSLVGSLDRGFEVWVGYFQPGTGQVRLVGIGHTV